MLEPARCEASRGLEATFTVRSSEQHDQLRGRELATREEKAYNHISLHSDSLGHSHLSNSYRRPIHPAKHEIKELREFTDRGPGGIKWLTFCAGAGLGSAKS